MKTANRAEQNSSKSSPASQSESTPKNASGQTRATHRLETNPPGEQTGKAAGPLPATVIPSHAVIDMIDALVLYRAAFKNAASLAMLLADNIRSDIKNYAGWECFDFQPGFAEGLFGAVRTALTNSVLRVDRVESIYSPMIERLRNVTTPFVCAVWDAESRAALLKHFGYDLGTSCERLMGDSNTAMVELLGLLSVIRDERNLGSNHGGYFIAEVVKDNLEALFDLLWKAMFALRNAAVAVVALGQEQKAAA